MLWAERFRRRSLHFPILVGLFLICTAGLLLYVCSSTDCCICYQTTVGLDIRNNIVSGHLPTEIGLLTSLGNSYLIEPCACVDSHVTLTCFLFAAAYAYLGANWTGTIPSEVGLMTALRESDSCEYLCCGISADLMMLSAWCIPAQKTSAYSFQVGR